MKNKEESYNRVPRLLDTRYSAKVTKGKCKLCAPRAWAVTNLRCVQGYGI